jgi:hypothetical protein
LCVTYVKDRVNGVDMKKNPICLEDKKTVIDYLEKFMARGTSIDQDPTLLTKICTIGNLVFNSVEESEEICETDKINCGDLFSEFLYQQIFVCFVECPRRINKTKFHEKGFFDLSNLLKKCLIGSARLKDWTIPARI